MTPSDSGFSMRHGVATLVFAVSLLVGAVRPSAAAVCTGDCNNNLVVSAGEVTTMIARVLLCSGAPTGPCSPLAPPDCLNGDGDGDNALGAGDVTNAVFHAIL